MALTPYLRLTKPPFDQIPWDQAINGDMDIIDGFIAQYMSVPNFNGAWGNSTPYVVGQVLLDTINSSMWICQVSHTSAAAPTTFSQDRTTHPTYWVAGTVPAGYLPLSGGTLTGPLNINRLLDHILPCRHRQGSMQGCVGTLVNIDSLVLELGDAYAETGSNVGTDFILSRYSDAGTFISSPMTINRATGATVLNGSTTINNT